MFVPYKEGYKVAKLSKFNLAPLQDLYDFRITPIGWSPGAYQTPRSWAESQVLAVWWLLESLTTPRPVSKSSTSDLAPRHCPL